MSQNLTTFQPLPHKIKIPRTAASYTSATMDQNLRSQINIQLVANGHDKKIQEHLLYSLNAHPNNWPTQIQNRALALLRSGDVQTFPALLRQILEEVRKETTLDSSKTTDGAANGSSSNGSNGNSNSGETVQVNGGGSGGKKAAANGPGAPGPGEASNLHTNTSTSLAVPQAVVDDALKVTRDALMAVVEFDDETGTT